jgi:Fic family protein
MIDSIFQPNYTITSAIEHNLEGIERNQWLIENMLLMPKHQAWLHRDVQVRRSSGTTRIEGAALDETAVRNLTSGGMAGKFTEDEQANLNAIQAYEFIGFISDQEDIPVDELVIRQLNRYFIVTASEMLTPGSYRKGSNSVGDFRTPDQGDVPGLMRSFALWFKEDDGVHPVLKAGIAHLHLVAIHPFWDGNGRTARGLETLLLQRSPFGFRKLISTETVFLNLKDDYFSAIGRTLGQEFSQGYDATPWLEFSTRVVKTASDDLVVMTTDWNRMMQQGHDLWAAKGWPPRHVDGYAIAVQTGQITRGDYMEITGVSPATASRDLNDMVNVGVLRVEGKTRTRVYYPLDLEAVNSGSKPGG